MPELPEVEAHAERMSRQLAGKRLSSFLLLNFASLKTFDPPPDGAVGAALIRVRRRAKALVLEFDNGHSHVIHLMQGGRLRPDTKQSRKPKFGLARWVFDGDDAWLLTEAGSERKAGIWVVDGDSEAQSPLVDLAPDATEFSEADLAELCAVHTGRIHGLLRDQRRIAGLGRMLANEILFEARISPFASAAKLTAAQIEAIHAAMQSVLDRSLSHERTLDDIGKSAERPSKVHNRAGESCLECTDTIRTVDYRAYTVYYCPTHQTDGRILADNTTSKFLK